MTTVQLTDLNYASLETRLGDFLKNTPEFSGYNFEGTVMKRFLKILAYNTYHQSYFLNMLGTENYWDSVQLRENLVSKAKALNYLTRSSIAATANLTLTFTPFDSPVSIFIPKYTAFRATVDDVTYNFLTLQDNYVQSSNGTYIKSVDVFEGQSYTYNIPYDSNQEFYEIPDPKVDVSKLKVYVRDNSLTNDRVEYEQVSDITEVTSDSLVYYIQENNAGNYEIYFGDGVLGASLENGNVIVIEAFVTNGVLGNNINTFGPVGTTGYNSNDISSGYVASVNVTSRSSEGQERESIASIRFSAPKAHAAQKRSVIASDYENYLLRKYPDLQSISVWGGENNDPPIYGRVIISVKPTNGYVISNFRKNQIITDLKSRNVMAIDPMIIDPIFTYVNSNSIVNFTSTVTDKTKEELFGEVEEAIVAFETDKLSGFKKSFSYSKFTSAIDSADPAIESNDTKIKFEKRIAPIYNSTITYKMKFSTALYNPYAGYLGCLSSTGFKLANTGMNTCYLDDDGKGNVRVYYDLNNERVHIRNVGTINYETGLLLLNSLNFTELSLEAEELRIYVEGASKTYTPVRNEILLLSSPKIQMFDTVQDTVVYSSIVDVLGNTSPIQTNSIINTVTI